VSFAGGISLSPRGHQSRSAALDYISRRLPVSLFLQMPSRAARWGAIPWDLVHGRLVRALTETPRQLLHIRHLHSQNLGPRFGLEMYEVLARSRITLNFHIDAAGSQAGNMRLFEATGMGACLVTDDKENLGSLFDVDGEIVAFRTWDDCVEKVRYLLDNDAARERIARAGQRRTLQEHTFEAQVRRAAEPLRALVAR
jgi:spore maturation protein CgeB